MCETPSIEYGTYDPVDPMRPGFNTIGDVLNFKCAETHVLKSGEVADFRIECMESGSWNPLEQPVCITSG